MASLADDISQLRASGANDDNILESLKAFKPQYADDINKLVKSGAKPKDIIDSTTAFDTQQQPPKDTSTKVVDAAKSTLAPFQKGVSDYLEGASHTLNSLGQGGQVSQISGELGKTLAPEGYQDPHFDIMHPIDTAGAIPKAIAQSLPELGVHSLAGMAGTAIGGPVGGALATGASVGLAHWGDAKQKVKESFPGISDEDANKRAAADIAINTALLRVGLPGIGGTAAKAGENALAHTLGEAGTNAAKMGAMSGGQSVADQGLLTGQVDPHEALNAAAVGAATGAGIRGLNAPRDMNIAGKNSEISPESGAKLSQHILDLNNGQVPQTPSEAHAAITKTRDNLNDLAEGLTAKDPAGEIKNHLKSLTDVDVNDPTPMTLTRVQSAIKRGDAPKPEDIQALRDSLGQTQRGAEYTDTLEKQGTLNQLLSQGVLNDEKGTFSSGISSSPAVNDWLSPTGAHGKYLGWAPLVGAAFGVHLPGPLGHAAMSAASPFSGLIGQFGAKKTLQVIDSALGNTNPLKNFMERYSDGTAGSPDYSNLPSFTEQLRTAKAEQLAKDQAAKASQQASNSENKASSAQAKVDAKTKEDQDAFTAQLALRRLAAQRATNYNNVEGYGTPLPEPDTAPVALDPSILKINKGAAQLSQAEAVAQARAQAQAQKARDAHLAQIKGQLASMKASGAVSQGSGDAVGPQAPEAGPTSSSLADSFQNKAAKYALGEAAARAKSEGQTVRNGEVVGSDASLALRTARLRDALAKQAEGENGGSDTGVTEPKAPTQNEPTSSSTKATLDLARLNKRVEQFKHGEARKAAKAEAVKKPKTETSSKAPKQGPNVETSSQASSHGPVSVSSPLGHTVTHTPSSIHVGREAYTRGMQDKVNERASHVTSAKALVDKSHHGALNALGERLDNGTKTAKHAHQRIAETVKAMGLPAHISKVVKATLGKVGSTYEN